MNGWQIVEKEKSKTTKKLQQQMTSHIGVIQSNADAYSNG